MLQSRRNDTENALIDRSRRGSGPQVKQPWSAAPIESIVIGLIMSWDVVGTIIWFTAAAVTCWNLYYSGRLADKIKSKTKEDK